MKELDFDQMIDDLRKKREVLLNQTDNSFSDLFDEDHKNCLEHSSQVLNKKFINYNLNDLKILDSAKSPEIGISNNFEINRIRGKMDTDNLRLMPIQRQEDLPSLYPRSVKTEDSGYGNFKAIGHPQFISRDQFVKLYKTLRKGLGL